MVYKWLLFSRYTCYVLINLDINLIMNNISPYIFGSVYEILFIGVFRNRDHSVVQLFITIHLLYL